MEFSTNVRVNICFIKVLAVGCSKRFAWYYVYGKVFCVRINDLTYRALRDAGVPTCQYLGYHHD